ncbi:MAG: SDR family NAD(P)-dependent oxidoreductase [Solirubrobacteraceae bacterium]
MDVEGRVVIVTGASSGIGEATARLLAGERAQVVLVARREERLQALENELVGSLAIAADLRDPNQIELSVKAVIDRFGRVDALVNNAGQGLHVALEQVRLADFASIVELNVYAPLLAMQAVIAPMRAQGCGAIVNVSSGTSRMVLPGVGAYAATKSALNMLSLVARAELISDGIVVSIVYPSVTATEFHDTLAAGSRPRRAGMTAHSPLYVARVIVRALRTGAAEIVIPHGPEQEDIDEG